MQRLLRFDVLFNVRQLIKCNDFSMGANEIKWNAAKSLAASV